MKKLCVIAEVKCFKHAVQQLHKTFSEAFCFGYTIISDLAHLAIFFCDFATQILPGTGNHKLLSLFVPATSLSVRNEEKSKNKV